MLVQPFGDECRDGRNYWHARQTCAEGLNICRKDFGAIGKVVRSVCAVVVHDDDAHRAVKEWPNGIVLKCFAAVDEIEFCLGGDEAGVVVIVEWIGVDGVFVSS